MALTTLQSVTKFRNSFRQPSQVLLSEICVVNRIRYMHLQATSQNSSANDAQSIKPFSEMPGPKGLPFIGTLLEFVGPMKKKGYSLRKMFKVFDDHSQIYGPVFKENLGAFTVVVISDPYEYSKVVRADGKYPRRPEMDPVKDFQLKRNLSLGIINSQNEEWYHHRSILNKKLLRPGEIQNYAVKLSDIAGDMTKVIRAARDNLDGVTPELERILFRWSLESVGMFVFDERIGCLEEKSPPIVDDFIRSVTGTFSHMNSLLFNPLYKIIPTKDWYQFEQCFDRSLRIGKELISEKLDRMVQNESIGAEKNGNFLSYLLSEKKLTPDQAITYAWDILSGGIETTANSLLWLLYALSKNPKVQEKLFSEILSVVKDSTTITADMLMQMPFVKACFKEQQRIFPLSIGTSRILQTDIELGGYHIPAETRVQPNIYGMGRNPRIFDEPLEFRPERWLRTAEGSKEQENNMVAISGLTFGHGPRMCLGKRLAEQEVYLATAKIIQNFHLEYAGIEDIQPVQNTVIIPDRPVKIRFIPRNKIGCK